jgi:hypothetical protein
VGLKYRFLFLERASKFSPQHLRFAIGIDLRSKINELLQQMNLLLREAQGADLREAQLLAKIFGPAGSADVETNSRIWEEAKGRLYAISHELLALSDDEVASRKSAFIATLEDFCRKTDTMNRDFTLKALHALQNEIGRAIGTGT